MDLRTRTTHALGGAGALLIVVGLSVGGGVAVADPAPAAQPPSGIARATTTSSDSKSSDSSKSSDNKSSDRKSKGRRSRNDQSGTDSTTDSTTDTSTSPTTTTPTTTTPSTTPPSTTATTRPTRTTAPPTTATTTPPTTTATGPEPAEPTPAGSNGQYNGGQPYQATEVPDDSTSTTTAPPTRKAKAPVSRSGDGLPPGVQPLDPGSNSADSPSSSPAPANQPVPYSPVVQLPAPVVAAQSQPGQPTTTSTAAASEPGAATEPSGGVSGTELERGDAGTARHGQELSNTGAGTRRLIMFGGVAMLLGAIVIAFTGRERPALAAAPVPVGPVRRARPRKELDGWEDGIPLAPVKRELARNRLGISGDSYYDDELEV